MSISVTCSGCGKRLRIADKLAGRQIKCPACRTVNRAPALESALADIGLAQMGAGPSPHAPAGSRRLRAALPWLAVAGAAVLLLACVLVPVAIYLGTRGLGGDPVAHAEAPTNDPKVKKTADTGAKQVPPAKAADGPDRSPPDGTWAEYSLRIQSADAGQDNKEFKGTIRRSIGKTTHRGLSCRWVEYQHTVEQKTTVVKMLFQEQGTATKPMRKALQVILKEDAADATEIDADAPEWKAIAMFFDAPLLNPQEVDRPELAVTGIGKVACIREQGKLEIALDPAARVVADATLWRSDQVPFHLVKLTITFDVKHTFLVELSKSGRDAASAILANTTVAVRPKLAAYAGTWRGKGLEIRIAANGEYVHDLSLPNARVVGRGPLTATSRGYAMTVTINKTTQQWVLVLGKDSKTLIIQNPAGVTIDTLTREQPRDPSEKPAQKEPGEVDAKGLPRAGAGDPALTYDTVNKSPVKHRGKRVTWSFVPLSSQGKSMMCALNMSDAMGPRHSGIYVVEFASEKEAVAAFRAANSGSTVTATVAGQIDQFLVIRGPDGVAQKDIPKVTVPLLVFPTCSVPETDKAKPLAGDSGKAAPAGDKSPQPSAQAPDKKGADQPPGKLPKADEVIWEGTVQIEGKGTIRLWVSKDGKTLKGAAVVAEFMAPGSLVTSYTPFREVPINGKSFKTTVMGGGPGELSGTFISATEATGEFSLEARYGINGKTTIKGKWTAAVKK